MSHVVTIQSKLTDAVAVAAACRRLNLPAPEQGTAQLYSGEVSGLIVRLPDWIYPAVVDTASGEVKYDNYGGEWGSPVQLAKFIQMYAVEKARIEAAKKGFVVTEQSLENGSIKLSITDRS